VLPPDAADRIDQLLRAELGPRNDTLQKNLKGVQRQLAARGMIGSGNAAVQFASIATDEIAVRGTIIWAGIRRAHSSILGHADASTALDLTKQLEHHIYQQLQHVRHYTIDQQRNVLREEASIAHIGQEIERAGRAAMDRFKVEAAFYVDELKRIEARAPKTSGITINAHSIGAVQTGTYAIAHVNVTGSAGDRLVNAVEALRASLQDNTEATATQRSEGDEIAGDLVKAVRSPQPNGSKISGLLGGLATTVQTIASMQPAWKAVRDAAIAVGILVGSLGG
jgi:hypothetical protein